jgi:hypothetical protein
MKFERTKTDIWVALCRKYKGKLLTVELAIEELDREPFWTEKELARGLRNWKADNVRRWMDAGPKVDTDGTVLERVSVKTVDKKTGTTVQAYLDLPSVKTYEDKVQTVEYHLGMSAHHRKEAKRLFNFYLPSLTPKERKRYVQHFQGLLDFGDDEQEQPA